MNSYSYAFSADERVNLSKIESLAEAVKNRFKSPSKEVRIVVPGVDEFYRCSGYFSEWMGIESGRGLIEFEDEINKLKMFKVVVLDV